MFVSYNLCKDLIRKEAYFEVGTILEDLFQISYVHDDIEYKLNEITIFHRFFHDHVKEEGKYHTRYEYLGELHREDGPAFIEYDENGKVIQEEYWLNDKRHRKDGPAIVEYGKDGNVIYEMYWLNDKLHRERGPAIIRRDNDGDIILREYYLYGEEQILD